MSPFVFLILAMLVLGAGPLLDGLSRRHPPLLQLIDGFILGSLGGLVLVFLLPHAIHIAGVSALAAAVTGLVLLSVMERVGHIDPDRTHGVGIALSLAGLLFHTAVDGMAVHGGGHDHGPLAEAVILHRLPVAIGVWWLVRPRYGTRVASIVLVMLALATALGFIVGGDALGLLGGKGAALFSAFVSGALVHVLFHRVAHASVKPGALHLTETAGMAFGLALLFLVPGHAEGLPAYGVRFLDLALTSAPAILLGFLMAGVVVVALPEGTVSWLRRGGSISQALRGTIFGIPLPICSCGVVPVYQGLLKKGAPPAAGLAFLVATPELGLESLFLSVPLLGGELTAVRLFCAFVVALAVGVIVSRFAGATPSPDDALAPSDDTSGPVASERGGLGAKARAALHYSFNDVARDTAAWILAGVALAAAVSTGSLSNLITGLPFGVDVLLAALIGLPIYVCASGATPLAAALLVAGVSPGAAVAFLLSGPATNVTTFGVLAQLHSKRLAIAFGVVTISVSVALGLLINVLHHFLFQNLVAGWAQGSHHEDGHSLLAYVSLAALTLVFGWVILREGPTAFLRPVLTLGDHHHEHGDHGHSHGDHGVDDFAQKGTDSSNCCADH